MLTISLEDSIIYLANYSSQLNNNLCNNTVLLDSNNYIIWMKYNGVDSTLRTSDEIIDDILTPLVTDNIWNKPWYFLIGLNKKWKFINKWQPVKYKFEDRDKYIEELLAFNKEICL